MLSRAGVPRHAVIKKFAGEDVSDVNNFLSILSKLSRGVRVPLEFITYSDRHRNKVQTKKSIFFYILPMA